MKTRIAVALGDPAGIGPELIAKLLSDEANRSRAFVLLIADEAEVQEGIRIAGRSFPYRVAENDGDLRAEDEVVLFEHPGSEPFARASATANGGAYSLETLRRAIEKTTAGVTQGVLFGPLNKSSMHQAGLAHEDESRWFADLLGVTGPHGELNVLDGLWTTRVTSHVALKDVPGLITRERIFAAIDLAHTTLRDGGTQTPRIAVCGLNPHNGDNGSFGREEIDVIGPAVEEARARGYPVTGPFPADTIFLKARDYDAIVTMYHDQGQIAMKLMGFSRGVTVHGGLPIPIATPAHGTAFDIYGRGKAEIGATKAAFDICVAMAAGHRRAAA
jgi:4-hydroxythreonine-4-phosphate dehydrogenase